MKNLLFLFFVLSINLNLSSQEKEFVRTDTIKLHLWATYYYVPTLLHDKNGIDLLDSKENKTGFKLNALDWCKAAIEGTVFITKDKKTFVLNYAGRSKKLQYDCRKHEKYKNYVGYLKTGKVLWSKSSGFGKGVRNLNLVPFKSIAVDNTKIPYGSLLYIPKAKGISYIDIDGIKKKHDGYFYAADTGSKIKGNHIDVFIGTEKENPFSFITSNKNKTFVSYVIDNKSLKLKLRKAHL